MAIQSLQDPANARIHRLDHGVRRRDNPIVPLLEVACDQVLGGLERRVRRTVGEHQKKWNGAMPIQKFARVKGQRVRQVAAVTSADRGVGLQVPVVVVGPSATEPGKLIESACIRFEPRIERAVVPLPDEAGGVAGCLEHVGHRRLAQRDAIQTVDFELPDRAGAVRIPSRQECGAGR